MTPGGPVRSSGLSGPIDLEFRGQYDPTLDQLTGQMWNTELDQTNDSVCE